MGKFDGILICTDLDGTVLNNEHAVSEENRRAIEYFKSEGGSFTFITGRIPLTARPLFEMIRPNVPYGCLNGGAIYDGYKNEYIWVSPLSKDANAIISFVEEKMTDIGIQINTMREIYFTRNNESTQYFKDVTGVPGIDKHFSEIDEPFIKVLFSSCDNDRILALAELLKTHPLYGDFEFIRSEKTLYELLPKGNSKGNVMARLVEYLGLDMNKTIAIGDYDNDISMLRAAKIGFAVANACDNAKRAADRITVSNEEHAIAKIIDELDRGEIKF